MENKVLPRLCADKECTGCFACVNVCPTHALSGKTNSEGYYRPSLNAEQCIGCHKCENSCPILTSVPKNQLEEIRVFAAWHKDEEVRRTSSSGGAFSAIAEVILAKGGVVFGAKYGDNLKIEHTFIDKAENLSSLRLSKYAQSNIGDTFRDVQEFLREGRLVLFVGTPCQVRGLKAFLHKDYENLILADIICHGVPSISFLQKYLGWLKERVGVVQHINFRDKGKGWYDNLRIVKVNGSNIALKRKDDCYWTAFNRNNCLQESCYNCQAQGFPRSSDITLADFWRIGHNVPFGHKNEIEKGVSMIVVNNPAKQKYVDEASKLMFIEERSYAEAIEGNQAGIKSSVRPQGRDTFYRDLQAVPFDVLIVKYMTPNKKESIMKIFREYLPFRVIKLIRLRNQK